MCKVLTIALWAWIPFCWQPLWGQTPNRQKDVTQNPKQKANLAPTQPQIGTDTSPVVVETHPRAESKEEAAKAKADKEHTANVETWTLIFTAAATLFTGLLVLVGWRGVCAANRTLLAIEDQGKQMKAQVELMEIPFEQWVNLTNWGSKRPTDNRFRVSVDVVNPTGLPMILNDNSSLTFSRLVDGTKLSSQHLVGRVLLSPNVPLTMNMEVQITDAELERGSLSFSVTGVFSHSHKITKREVVWNPVGILNCSPWQIDKQWHTVFTQLTRMNPGENKGDNPGQTQDRLT